MIFVGFVTLTAAIMPLQFLAILLRRPHVIPVIYHRAICALLDIRLDVRGVPLADGPVLLVCNHTSWLDIPILSALAPLSFVAKSEVRKWPFFGLLAQLQATVFIERSKRTDTRAQRDQILARLAQGDRLVLFPEGTSGDGNKVLPFNSALFSVAEHEIPGPAGHRAVVVQPISVTFSGFRGLPMSRRLRPKVAWYGDMALIPHLFGVFGLGPIDVTIDLHQPVTIAQFGSRKALAAHCHRVVAQGVARALVGRAGVSDPVPQTEPAAGEPDEVAITVASS